MPNCARCGADNDASANFCKSCGSPMNAPGYAPPPPPPPPTADASFDCLLASRAAFEIPAMAIGGAFRVISRLDAPFVRAGPRSKSGRKGGPRAARKRKEAAFERKMRAGRPARLRDFSAAWLSQAPPAPELAGKCVARARAGAEALLDGDGRGLAPREYSLGNWPRLSNGAAA